MAMDLLWILLSNINGIAIFKSVHHHSRLTHNRNLGEALQKSDYEKALQEREIFRSTFVNTILPCGSLNFLLVPADGDEPNYRDQYFRQASFSLANESSSHS
jgi:hypothetical protein